jgi:phenylacetate-coenzyme A ligase PaaK-like adenylate-forming protein
VNLYPAAVDAVVRSVAGIGEYQVEIDQRTTLPEVTVRFDVADGSGDPTPALAKHQREAFQMRIEVEKVPGGTLPVFEMKARRWRILT